ncbi:MAG: DUF1925 domain-containing protein [Methanobacteriota archaeon]|nr:MAG: DUF1925 domain-containing protein [Euryarchaeota archaeon]
MAKSSPTLKIDSIENPIEGKVNFVNVFHFHQPIGQFHSVFEEGFRLSYDPLISTLEEHPGVKAGIHITGPLLEWLITNRPAFIERLKRLINRNQIEMIGGGYYEPILAVIPNEDRVAQLKLLSDKIEEIFGVRPRGTWLAERAWEPSLVNSIVEAGLEFIFVDDFHIKNAGIFEPDIHHTFNTEDQGKSVIIFPINESIRYLVPWKEPEEIFNYLSSQIQLAAEKSQSNEVDESLLITNIDDAEKLGMWPKTFDRVYGSVDDHPSWIQQWFHLTENIPWVNSLLPSEYVDKFRPHGLVYLPTASYDKMGVWALPTPARKELEALQKLLKSGAIIEKQHQSLNTVFLKFLKGSFWRNFLVKYPESNAMHKRMLYSRKKLEKAIQLVGQTSNLDVAYRYILAAQCNDVYWHGQFGGLYFYFLRYWTFRYLLKADRIIEPLISENYSDAKIIDYDFDGTDDVILENRFLSVFINPSPSFSLAELDFKPTVSNLITTLRRVPESYHPDGLTYDLWRKNAFIDFILESMSLEEFLEKKTAQSIRLAQFNPSSMEIHPSSLSAQATGTWGLKSYSILDNRLSVHYHRIPKFGVIEINLTLDDAVQNIRINSNESEYEISDEFFEIPKAKSIILSCSNPMEPKIHLEIPDGCSRLLVEPIYPLSLEEGKLFNTFQGLTIYLHFTKEVKNAQISITVTENQSSS